MISIGYGTKGFPDFYKCCKRNTDEKEKLGYKNNKKNRFKARDYIDFETSSLELNGVTHNDRNNLTIETPVMLDFQNDDLLFDIKSNIYWRITKVQIVDDGQAKENSTRPRKLTRLTLIR